MKNFSHRQNNCKLFHALAQLLFFTTSELELDYYHQKVNVPANSWAAEWLKTENLRILGNSKKIPEKFGIDDNSPVDHPKAKFWQLY